jgi:hypothetical protein
VPTPAVTAFARRGALAQGREAAVARDLYCAEAWLMLP